jgi:hypothetical protein
MVDLDNSASRSLNSPSTATHANDDINIATANLIPISIFLPNSCTIK